MTCEVVQQALLRRFLQSEIIMTIVNLNFVSYSFYNDIESKCMFCFNHGENTVLSFHESTSQACSIGVAKLNKKDSKVAP